MPCSLGIKFTKVSKESSTSILGECFTIKLEVADSFDTFVNVYQTQVQVLVCLATGP
jgi:hypothetical protein